MERTLQQMKLFFSLKKSDEYGNGNRKVELQYLCENVHSERYGRPYLDNYDDLEYNEDRWRDDSRN